MTPKKLHSNVNNSVFPANGGGRPADLQDRAAFTSAMVAALKELQSRSPSLAKDLGQRAYQKLQYDLPLVSPEELEGLTDTLRASLQLKSGKQVFPITSKLLENVVAGARAPITTDPASSSTQSHSLSSAARSNSCAGSAEGVAPGATSSVNGAVTGPCTIGIPDRDDSAAIAQGAARDHSPSSLMDTKLLNPDHKHLCSAFRALCAVIFVQLVSHSLAVSEQDTWSLLYAIGSDSEDNAESDGDGSDAHNSNGTAAGAMMEEAQSSSVVTEAQLSARLSALNTETSSLGMPSPSAEHSQPPHFDGNREIGPSGGSRHDIATAGNGTPTGEHLGQAPKASEYHDGNGEAGPLPQPVLTERQMPPGLYEELQAAEEDGDDFEFEDLEVPCSNVSVGFATTATQAATVNGYLSHAPAAAPSPALLQPPPPYSWPALRARLMRLAGQVSYALLDEQDLWRDGELLQGVFQLLRALGAHRHSQELQPLLHAYVGLVSDRIVAEPSELSCLDSLWDAVGLQCIASLPQVGRQRTTAAGSARGGGPWLLLAEATTCLSLVATLSGQLTSASAKLRLWQQVHKHMLPLLERCLGELARMVGPGPWQSSAGSKSSTQQPPQQQRPQPELKSPGAEEVAAIVLVCQVLDFYVHQRPGNADLAVSLKGTGVLASLSILFAAAAALPGAEPLRSAVLCCAASSRELHAWVLGVPGVAKALAAPAFQEDGAHEAHGAMWEILNSSSGSSPLALSILANGAAPEKAVRVHALLQLLAKAAACRGGRGVLWGPAVERAMRELYAALRQGQASGNASSAPSGRVGIEEKGQDNGGAPAVAVVERRSGGAEALTSAAVDSGVGGERESENAVFGQDRIQQQQEDEDGDQEEDEKLHLLDPNALQRRRARQLHPACWRILKQLLTASGESAGKTD